MNYEIKNSAFRSRLEEIIGQERPFPWAERIGLTPGVFNRMWNDGIPPKADSLERIAEATGISIDWLLSGKGPKWRDKEGNGRVETAAAEYRAAPEMLDPDEFVLVPRYDVRASTGPGALVASEQVVDHLAFKRKWVRLLGLQADQLALITTKGDSMEPTIKDGFLLLVDLRQNEVSSDGIYVLRLDHDLIAKRLQKLFTGDLKIKSDNPAYDEQQVPVDQIDKLNIIGRVVWGGGRM